MIFLRSLFLLLCLLVVGPSLASTVLPVSLPRLATTAEIIFHGKAISNEVKVDETSNRVATFTTFEIIDNVKGDTGATYIVKQIGGQLPGSRVMHKFHGVPQFTTGEEYVVFLPKKSRLGFASPIGLGQGRFSVLKQNGITTVSNGRALKNLLTPDNTNNDLSGSGQKSRNTQSAAIPSIPDQPTKARLADFIKTVRVLAKE